MERTNSKMKNDTAKAPEGSSSGAASNNNSVRSIAACPMDIICGRGFHIVNHRGNLNLHLTVNKYRDEYQQSKRSHKTKMIKQILSETKSTGARFIRRVSNGANGVDEWEEVGDVTAYQKISHALRLKTLNETNRETGPIAAAGGFDPHHAANVGAGDSATKWHRPTAGSRHPV